MKNYLFLLFIVYAFFSCEKQSTVIEKQGEVINYFTGAGEPGVEVCSEVPKSCITTDQNGRFTFAIESNEYLLREEYFSSYYTYSKPDVKFTRFKVNGILVNFAVPRTWIRVNIAADAPFKYFELITSQIFPRFPAEEVIPGQSFSKVFEITYTDNYEVYFESRWWEKFLVRIDYFNFEGDLIHSPVQTLELKSLDTIDVNFNF